MTPIGICQKRSAARIHRESIKQTNLPWMILKNNRTCLTCLRRKPEYNLSCGHSLCEICLQIFGEVTSAAEYQFHLASCVLCRNGQATVTLKPPTAGVRILTIDGGGVRGVIPLEFLDMMQEAIGKDCPIQNLFDLVIGTSSGNCFRHIRLIKFLRDLVY